MRRETYTDSKAVASKDGMARYGEVEPTSIALGKRLHYED